MQRKSLTAVALSLLVVFSLTTPAIAFYFDFQYFETDKMVYEVGETINMAAGLIADFSLEGWCYVSFAAVTDLGPVFADDYFIPPLPDARVVNSSYTILPQHTNPGVTGTIAHILFNVEIFDTVSQGAGDSIEVSITRGRLTVIPVSSLTVQSGTNLTLHLRVSSIHDNNIPYSAESINIQIKNPNSVTILDDTISTSIDGTFSFNWSSSMGPPGIYNLAVTGFGNDDFLGFSKSLPISVVPAISNLCLLLAPESIQCQSPDGSHFETAEIVIRHEAADQTGINDSTIYWSSSFGSGEFTSSGNGTYIVSIPFQIQSGDYIVNITAINQKYETTSRTISIEVIKNTLSFYPSQSIWSVQHGDSVLVNFTIEEEFNWGKETIIHFLDDLDEIALSTNVTPGTDASLLMICSSNLSIGLHMIYPHISSEYYSFANDTSSLQLIILGELSVNITVLSAYYGENLEMCLSVLETNNDTVEMVLISVYYGDEISPFVITGQIDSTQMVSMELPLWITPGFHILHFEFSAPNYMPAFKQMNVSVWMRTNMTIIVEQTLGWSCSVCVNCAVILQDHDFAIFSTSSIGSIIRPPPILLSGTTSIELPTARLTSLINCPRFSSGTSILSTDSLNSLTALSGKGQSVLSRMDFTPVPGILPAITSSTDLDVDPKETTPHFAVSGPDIT